MKNFLKIFIFLEIILFAYIFNTSIYNIYEKNNIATEKLEGYVLEETSPEILDKFYTIFTENYSQNKLELINNTLTSTDKSVYDLYCYPLNEFTQKQPISSSILFQYHELQEEDFLDSIGVFYTDLPVNAIKEIASQLSVTINTFENDAIPYSMVLELNLLNFVILFIVLQIIYCIYTSYSLKKIGVKKSMGFSTIHILKEQITSIIKYFSVTCFVLLVLLNLYYALTNRYDFSYLVTIVLFFMGVLTINVLCVLITSILIKFVSLEAMIKNKTLNSGTNIVVQTIKIIFSVIIAITIISLLKQGNSFRQSQQAVLDYKYLDGYYTATFTIVFIVSLLFVLYISNYVDIFVNRKRYAAKEILGFSHFRILKNRYIFLGIELIISGVLTVINYYFACLFAIILIDYIFCELLYKVYISNALYEIEKGA